MRILLLIVLFILLLELGWLFLANFPQKIAVVETGTITKGCWIDGVYLRDETLFRAPMAGFLTIRVVSGTMIPNGEVIGWISRDENRVLPDAVIKSAKKLALFNSETKGLELELKRLNSEIAHRLARVNRARTALLKQSADLASLEKEKQRVFGNIQYNREQAKQIRARLNSLTDGVAIITTESSGIFCSEYDGFENQLTPKSFRKLPEEIVRKRYSLKAPSFRVSKDDPIGKIIQPFTEMLVVKINPRQVGIPRVGDEWEVKTTNGWRNIKIIDIISLANDKMMVGFNNRNPDLQFAAGRRQKLFVVYRRVKGTSIPVQAIFRKKEKSYVRIVKGDDFREQEIRVLETDGNRAIVAGLEFGTAILSR